MTIGGAFSAISACETVGAPSGLAIYEDAEARSTVAFGVIGLPLRETTTSPRRPIGGELVLRRENVLSPHGKPRTSTMKGIRRAR